MTVRKMFFFYCNEKLDLMLEKEGWSAYWWKYNIFCNTCNNFSIFFSYRLKKSVEIKGFIKEYFVLSLHYATFLSH